MDQTEFLGELYLKGATGDVPAETMDRGVDAKLFRTFPEKLSVMAERTYAHT